MTALKRFASAVLRCCSNRPPARDLRRGVAVAEDDVVHAVRGRSVVLDRPAVRAAVERRRADDHAAARRAAGARGAAAAGRAGRAAAPGGAGRAAAAGRCRSCRRAPPRCRRCRSCPPRPPCRPCRRRFPAAPEPAVPVVPPGPTLPALPVVPAVSVVAAVRGAAVRCCPPRRSFRRWRSSPRSRSCLRRLARCCRRFRTAWYRLRGRRQRRGGQPRARGMRNEGAASWGFVCPAPSPPMGGAKNSSGRKNIAKFPPAGHSPSGSVHVPMHQAGW